MKTLTKKLGILAAGLLMLAVSGCAEMDLGNPALEAEQEQAMIEAEWEEWKAAFDMVVESKDGTYQTDDDGDDDGDGDGDDDGDDTDDTVWPDPFDPNDNNSDTP